jgi:hypothetical protein
MGVRVLTVGAGILGVQCSPTGWLRCRRGGAMQGHDVSSGALSAELGA